MAQRPKIMALIVVVAGLFLPAVQPVPSLWAGIAASDAVIEVIGSARVQGDSVDAARSEAISNCLIAAIDQAASSLLPLAFRVERFNALNQTLYKDHGKFVYGYKNMLLFQKNEPHIYPYLMQFLQFRHKLLN